MAKRSKRRQAKQNKDEAGCMWGLISMFDFRHGRTTRRLLPDTRIMNKNTVSNAYSISEVDILSSSEDRHVSIEDVTEGEKPILDIVKTSVKELMEEEMVGEQDSTKQTDGDTKKSSNDHVISISHQASSQKTSHYGDIEALMKEILLIYQKRDGHDLDDDRNHTFSVVEEKLTAAVEAFMSEKSNEEHSKDFIDTLQMLSSNKELFLKLLQDQASLNPNEGQKSKSKSKSKLNPLENKTSDPKQDILITRKHKNFFRRRSKSQESMPLSRIVILKPNSPDNRLKLENDVHSERISSHFSFMDIKKRLKNAIGKEQPKPGGNEKTVVEGSNGWSSPNRDHFYTEKFAKRIERVSKLKESEIKQREDEENGDSSRHISNIYIEAKKHLSEMLSGGDEDADLIMENLPRTLGKILSHPHYNSLSPGASPRKENEGGYVTAIMRLCPHGNHHSVNESQPRVASVDVEEKPKVSDEVNPDACRGASPSSMVENTSPQGVLEIEKPEDQEEMEVLEISCQPCSSTESRDDEHDGAVVGVSDEERSPTCFKADVHEENEFSSPMGSSLVDKIEEPESTSSDKTGRPSPVSVLEPLFSDNEISPASTSSQCGEQRPSATSVSKTFPSNEVVEVAISHLLMNGSLQLMFYSEWVK